jgi:thioredoxin reductase (NADPH)
MYQVVIMGSGIAGFTAAIYTARAGYKPLVISGLPMPGDGGVLGGQLTITSDVENYPGFPEGISGPDLMERVQKQAEKFGAEVLQDHVATADARDRPFKLKTVNGKEIEASTLIIASGATAKYLGLPGETRLKGKGVSACATCDGFFFRAKNIFVAGGGDTAMEEATYLTRFASSVTIIHRRDEFRASTIMLQRAQKNPKIRFKTPFVITDVLGADHVTGLKLKNNKTGQEEEVPAEGLFLGIGHQPNTKKFRGQLDMSASGYLKADNRTRVMRDGLVVHGLYAAGDVADELFRQAVTAAGSGCAAAIEATRFLETEENK